MKLAAILLALGLTISGVTFGVTGSAPTLPDRIALFGGFA